MHHIFLIPGFFGFANLGNIVYFAHVQEFLAARLEALGLEATFHTVQTDPTASLPSRAVKLLESVEAARITSGDNLHLVGHSSGGLDARLFASHGVSVPTTRDAELNARLLRSVISVATPHRGTPLASFFNSLFGKQILGLLSLATIYMLRHGPLPLSALLKLGALFVRLDDHLGFRNTVADHLFDELLRDFTPDRRKAIGLLLDQMRQDSSLLAQLTPESATLFNALTTDRPGTRYASVVCATPRPGLRSIVGVGLDPYAQGTHALYIALSRITGRSGRATLELLSETHRSALTRGLRFPVTNHANDGIVPLSSQPWGEVIHVTDADHLDVIGHFAGADLDPPHRDWFTSGSTFKRPEFEALWSDVALFIKGAAP